MFSSNRMIGIMRPVSQADGTMAVRYRLLDRTLAVIHSGVVVTAEDEPAWKVKDRVYLAYREFLNARVPFNRYRKYGYETPAHTVLEWL